MSLKFASLHNHSQYSLLDGLGTSKQYITACINKGIYSFAVTDHGTTSGVLDFYNTGKKLSYPVILGEEFYIEDSQIVFAENKKELNRYYHIIVLAKNNIGYQNLLKLSSLAYATDRFYFKPRITFEDLFNHKEGLIVSSGCIQGPIAFNVIRQDPNIDLAYEYAKKFKEQFHDDWFIELQFIDTSWDWDKNKKDFVKTDYNPQEKSNKVLLDIANSLDIPVIVTTDAHMVNKEDKIVQDVAIQTSTKGWHFKDTYYLKTSDEIWEDIKKIHPYVTHQQFEKMCLNTVEIADKCKLDLKFKPQIRKYSTKEGNDKIIELINKHNKIDWNNKRYVERLKKEISVIKDNGKIDLLDYFIVLEDLVSWCKNNNVIVGPGRGSGCGSLLVYALDITTIDPLQYDLLFERFLSLPRIQDGTLPDIDLDFSDPNKAKEYLRTKYGEDKVFSIGIFQQIKIKQAWTDVCRIMLDKDFVFMENKLLSKGLPSTGPSADLVTILEGTYKGFLTAKENVKTEEAAKYEQAIDSGVLTNSYDEDKTKDWINWINTHPKGKEIYDVMLHILGVPRQVGSHACGVSISIEPMNKVIPTAIYKDIPTTQFSAEWCEYAGIIKYDILGLNTLKDFQECLKLIKQRHDKEIDIYNIPTDDQRVFAQFNIGNTDTVFQFNTSLQKFLLKKIKVNTILDLAVVNAIGRPGPLSSGMVQKYVEGKSNTSLVKYEHPKMQEITGDFYGCVLFQEQIIKFFTVMAGLSLVESENVRRAISKHKESLLLSYKEKFIEYATSKLEPILSIEEANKLWDMIFFYSQYSFNASHAVAYSLIGYICMWLKTYYPLEWWCGVFKNCNDDDFKKLYRTNPVEFVLPDINLSRDSFYIDDSERIVIPFTKVTQVGDLVAKEIISKQPYLNFEHFFNKVNKSKVKKNVFINLIFAGCFEKCEQKSKEEILDQYYCLRKEEKPLEFKYLDRIQAIERQTNALSFKSINYFDLFSKEFGNVSTYDVARLKIRGHGIVTGGKIVKKEVKKTKKGKKFIKFKIFNDNDFINAYLWDADKKDEQIKENKIIKIYGEINMFNNETTIIVKNYKILF